MVYRIPAIVVLLFTMATSMVAKAGRRADAEKLAAAGELLFEAGKYRDALQQFLDAYALFEPPKFIIPEVIWNIGRCYEELGDDESAIRYFEEFHRLVKAPDYRSKAEAKIRYLRERMQAVLTLDVEPDGATVVVDGREVGKAPLKSPIRLDPGEHEVGFTHKGYREQRKKVTLKTGEARILRIKMQRETGAIRVVGIGGPATGPVRVLIDGREAYHGPLPARLEVPAGQRAVRVEGPEGTEATLRYVEVPERGEVEVVKAFPKPEPFQVVTPQPRPEPAPMPAVTEKAEPRFPWHFVVIGTGAAALIGGGVMTGLAANDRSKVSNADTYPDGTIKGITQTSASSAVSAAKTKDTISYVLYGTGGAAVVAGLLWWLLGDHGSDESATVTTVPSAVAVEGGALLGATGRF